MMKEIFTIEEFVELCEYLEDSKDEGPRGNLIDIHYLESI